MVALAHLNHLLFDHLIHSAQKAESLVLQETGSKELSCIAYYNMLYHDLGKFAIEFQKRLKNKGGEATEPYHSYFGAIKICNVCQILVPVILGHHTKLSNFTHGKNIIKQFSNHPKILNIQLPQKILNLFPSEELPIPAYLNSSLNIEFLQRYLFSVQRDIDLLDTEEHCNYEKYKIRKKFKPTISELHEKFCINQNQLVKKKHGKIDKFRNKIYNYVIEQAKTKNSFFLFTAPSGSGKTRTSIAFALKHAIYNDMKRIIIAVPYLSTIDQTAEVCKDLFGEDAILEHHSDIIYKKDSLKRLHIENWDVTIIITSAVQLFETLHSNKKNKCRKLHNMTNSVIIIDEPQTLPIKYMNTILEQLNQLVKTYKSSIIFTTATPPLALDSNSMFKDIKTKELVPDPIKLFKKMKRVEYLYFKDLQPCTWKELATEIKNNKQILIIVNTKNDTIKLFNKLKAQFPLVLSNRKYSADKKRTIKEIKKRLDLNLPCCVISTQVIESGVDLDFPCVFRALGPLDSIVQAAGRCNREGKYKKGKVIIFNPKNGSLPKSGGYFTATNITEIILKFNPDFDNPEIWKEYFSKLYTNVKESEILKLRSNFDFDRVDKEFKIIPNNTVPVLLFEYPAEDQKKVEDILKKEMSFLSLRNLQPYLINLFENEIEKYTKEGFIRYNKDLEMFMWYGKYNKISGLDMTIDPSDLII